MSARALLIEIRWPDGRFHGVREGRETGRGAETVAEWPPSPFRLFQALVAGAYGGRWARERTEDKDAAFAWLEQLDPPTVLAPRPTSLRTITYFVPNNDLDAKGGDPALVASVRTSKTLRTSLFDPDRPAAYLWTFDGDEAPARRVTELADRLHTLGHGIDAAFATAEVLDAAEAEARLFSLGGAPRRPFLGSGVGEGGIPCPVRGSLASLQRRQASFKARLERVGAGRKASIQFRQPQKALTRTVAYDRVPARLLFELKPLEGRARFRSWPLAHAASLVVAVRDQAARALAPVWPAEVERLIVGRTADRLDAEIRLRVIPLPSIGMIHTNQDIRRVLIEVPVDHPIPPRDIEWALAGRELADVHGELLGVVLAPANDRAMLDRYGLSTKPGAYAARRWHTVTPAALPKIRGRDGQARAASEAGAAGALIQALRHAGIVTPVTDVTIQREPFDLRGEKSDSFESDRFGAGVLRHVALTFARPIEGPIVIGDGRWLGLGVMRPTSDRGAGPGRKLSGLHMFRIEAGPALRPSDAEALTRALRRAVMARAQAVAGTRLQRGDPLPGFFTGHGDALSPTRGSAKADGLHEHLFYGLDPTSEGATRLLIVAPHLADRGGLVRTRTRRWLGWLSEAVEGFDDLRAGSLGRFQLAPLEVQHDDTVLGSAKVWTSVTFYQPTRHAKGEQDFRGAVIQDVLLETQRRSLPRPNVEVLTVDVGPRGGIRARLQLQFAVAVGGPLLLGKNSHFGAGLFACDHAALPR